MRIAPRHMRHGVADVAALVIKEVEHQWLSLIWLHACAILLSSPGKILCLCKSSLNVVNY